MLKVTLILIFFSIFCSCSNVKNISQASDLKNSENANIDTIGNFVEINSIDEPVTRSGNNNKPSGLNTKKNENDLSVNIYVYESLAFNDTTKTKINDKSRHINNNRNILIESTPKYLQEEDYEILQEAKDSFILGLIGLFFSLLGLGIPIGLVFAIIAITKGKRAKEIIGENPDVYINADKAQMGILFGMASIVLIILQAIALILFFILLYGLLGSI